MSDQSKKWSEYLRELADTQRRWQQQLESLLEPQKRLQEHLARLSERHRRMQEQLDSLLEPHKHFQELIQRLLPASPAWLETIDDFIRPHERFRKQIEQLLEPIGGQEALTNALAEKASVLERLEDFVAPQKRWQEQITSALDTHTSFVDRINAVTDIEIRWKDLTDSYLSGVDWGQISISKDGTITVGTETVDAAEVTAEWEHLADELSTVTNPIEYVNRLVDFIGRLRKPLAQLLIYVLLPYVIAILANLTTPIFRDWRVSYSDVPKAEIPQAIKEEASAHYTAEELKEYRFVVATQLNVRAEGVKQADLVDELPLGKIVKVLKVANWWTQVEYFDDEQGVLRQGWVFTRYLGKFN